MVPSLARSLLVPALVGASLTALAAATGPDRFFPTFGNSGYDVLHYALDIDASRSPRIRGTAALRMRAEAVLPAFELDLHGLTVRSVTVDGRPAAFEHEDDKLAITPHAPIAAGARFNAEIVYAGTPDPLPDPTYPNPEDELPLGWIASGANSSYALSEPVGASSFYPANDIPTDKATFSIRVTVPQGVTGVANGDLEKVVDNGDTTTFVWEMRQPMTTWLATVHINTFELVEQGARGIPFRYYITPEIDAAEREALEGTPKIMRYLIDLVGEYPFQSYGSVIVDDDRLPYALETQTMSTFPSDFVETGVIAHELAHQWFGNSVTVRKWKDLWLAEGFATYFEFLFPMRDDPGAFDELMRSIHAFLVRTEAGPAVISSPLDLFSNSVYYRGAATLYALQLEVGDDVFFSIVREWYATYRDRNATSNDFIDIAVAVSGDGSVRDLLEDWLYEEPVPPLGDEALVAARTPDFRAAMGEALVRTHKANHGYRRGSR